MKKRNHVQYIYLVDRKTNEKKISLFVSTPYFYEAKLDLSSDEKHDEIDIIMIPICFDNSHNKDAYAVDRSLSSFHPIMHFGRLLMLWAFWYRGCLGNE
jgi:hypothetical protein